MPEEPVYCTGPDGLPARIVGPWVERKDHFVDTYAHMVATGMKNRWPNRAYVELFAGPGVSWDKTRQRFRDGSALRSLGHEFTNRVFVDIDQVATDALRRRIADRRPGLIAPVLQLDCNAAVEDIRTAVPANALTLVFVDPTNYQVRMDTLRRLTENRTMDLLITFHEGILRRLTRVDPPAVDAFFDTPRWKDCLRQPTELRAAALRALYGEQLARFGYQSGRPEDVVLVRNTMNRVIYSLVLYSRNLKGHEFWRKAIQTDELGRRSLWD